MDSAIVFVRSRKKGGHVLSGVALLILSGLLACAVSPPGTADETPSGNVEETPSVPEYQVAAVKAEDSVALKSEGERLVISVQSKSGIGGATVRLVEGVWPDVIVMRFRYVTGDKFRGLEGFSVMTGKLGVSSFLGNPVKPALCRLHRNGWIDEKSRVGAIELEIADKEDCIEVILPVSSLGEDAKSLKFTWVDQYR
jgi:hypothetical protein